jgi:hypothetical protein
MLRRHSVVFGTLRGWCGQAAATTVNSMKLLNLRTCYDKLRLFGQTSLFITNKTLIILCPELGKG